MQQPMAIICHHRILDMWGCLSGPTRSRHGLRCPGVLWPTEFVVVPQANLHTYCTNGTDDRIPENTGRVNTRGIHEKMESMSRRSNQMGRSPCPRKENRREEIQIFNSWNRIGRILRP